MKAFQEAASCSASGISRYHVFLSFRGKDTRWTFVYHLYRALINAGFRTFRDNNDIESGESIKLELQTAIKESQISIVIFSKNYASSSWCLDELVMILKRKKSDSMHVLPVFYDVDPSDVRQQKKYYAKAFARHEKRFKLKGGEGEANQWKEKLKAWKEALEEAANLAGMSLLNHVDRNESKFIQKIVKIVEDKLRPRTSHPIGLDPGGMAPTHESGDCIGMESCADLQNNQYTGHGQLVKWRETEEVAGGGGGFRQRAEVKRREMKEFPPPMPTLAMKRYSTGHGQLVIREEKVRHHEYFRAHRSGGRLTLQLVPPEEEEEKREEIVNNVDANHYDQFGDNEMGSYRVAAARRGTAMGV